MLRHTLTLAAAAFLGGALVLGTGAAFAQSGSERECTAQGGTYIKDGPDSICAVTETKDVKGNAFGTETTDTTTGQGNLGNKPVDECSGNVGQCKQ